MYSRAYKSQSGDAGSVVRSSSRKSVSTLRHSSRGVFPQPQPRSPWSVSPAKRLFDVLISAVVLMAFSFPMIVIALLIWLFSDGPAIFAQTRIGRGGRPFQIYKFRSMVVSVGVGAQAGPTLTKLGDTRVTRLGYWLRKFKLDELPQFYNVLRGDMSLVGPRPKLPQYAERLTAQFRPGITGAATLAFRSEEEILKQVHPRHMEHFYLRRIKPVKERIDLRYMRRATLWSDLALMLQTLRLALVPARIHGSFRNLERAKAPGRIVARTGASTVHALYAEREQELVIAE